MNGHDIPVTRLITQLCNVQVSVKFKVTHLYRWSDDKWGYSGWISVNNAAGAIIEVGQVYYCQQT